MHAHLGIVARLIFPDQFTEVTSPVANTPQARKRARQAETRRLHNAGQRSAMRTAVKKVLSAIKAGDADSAKAALDAAVPVIDGAAGKGIIHRNKAARHKSRLNSKVKALGAA